MTFVARIQIISESSEPGEIVMPEPEPESGDVSGGKVKLGGAEILFSQRC